MAALNSLFIIGNVGRDAEMRQTVSGKTVASFSVAVSKKRGSGEDAVEDTEWFNVSCWDRQAEFADQYVKKGRQVAVTGPVRMHRYQNKDGEERSSMEVTARDVQLLGSRNEDGERPAQSDLSQSMPF